MVRPSNQQAYTVANGTSKIGAPVQQNRDPTTLDVNYTLYDQWQNTSTGILFELVSFTSTSGTVLANWVQFATNTTTVQTLTGDSGGAVGPTGSPGNINLLGTAGQITVVGTPGTSTLTFALANGGTPIDSITVDAATAPGTNPVVPTGAGLITMTGGQVATGTIGANVIRTDSLAANSLKIEVQRSTTAAATDSTKNGVSHFNSSMFSVDGSGFVSLSGGGQAVDSFIPDSGTSPVVPAADGSVTMSGAGSITTVGGTNTLTTQLTGLTNHAVLVGAGTTTITKVGPSATTGAPLISGGAAADPGFSTTFTIVDATPITTLSKASAGAVVTFSTKNTSTNTALISSTANSAGNGAGYFSSGQYDTTKYWNFGMVPTNAGTNAGGYNISYNTVGQADPSGGTTTMRISTAGDITIPARLGVGSAGPSDIITASNSTASTGIQIAVRNTSNTASSFASIAAVVGGASADDPISLYQVTGAGIFTAGIDNSDSDKYKISGSSDLGTNNYFAISSAGAITFDNAYTFPTADGTAGQVLTTNGAGTVTWSSSGVGTWTDTSGVFTASRNSAYFLTAASTATLPASPAQGDTVDFVCDTTGSCVITGNTGQFIRIASQLSSAAGTATNSARGDTLSLVYRAATTTWFAFDAPNGGWTTA